MDEAYEAYYDCDDCDHYSSAFKDENGEPDYTTRYQIMVTIEGGENGKHAADKAD